MQWNKFGVRHKYIKYYKILFRHQRHSSYILMYPSDLIWYYVKYIQPAERALVGGPNDRRDVCSSRIVLRSCLWVIWLMWACGFLRKADLSYKIHDNWNVSSFSRTLRLRVYMKYMRAAMYTMCRLVLSVKPKLTHGCVAHAYKKMKSLIDAAKVIATKWDFFLFEQFIYETA